VYIIHKKTFKKTKKWYIIVPLPYKGLNRVTNDYFYGIYANICKVMCAITNTTAVVIRDFEQANRAKINITNLNDIGYFTFLHTKYNGRIVIILTLEDRLWKRVCTKWEWDRYDGTRGLMLRSVALEPQYKNNSNETVYTYTDMNWEQDRHRLLIAVAHVPSHASSYGICGKQGGTVTALSPSTSESDIPCRYNSTRAP
jgi:hypothetical protein